MRYLVRLVQLVLLVIAVISPLLFCPVQAEVSKELLLEYLDFLVSETLSAYNADNYIEFYKYFTSKMDPVTTAQYFKVTYQSGYKENIGYFESKELLSQRSSLDYDFPVLLYNAKFSKHDDVLVSVYFKREDDKYKITDLRFDKNYHFDHYQ